MMTPVLTSDLVFMRQALLWTVPVPLTPACEGFVDRVDRLALGFERASVYDYLAVLFMNQGFVRGFANKTLKLAPPPSFPSLARVDIAHLDARTFLDFVRVGAVFPVQKSARTSVAIDAFLRGALAAAGDLSECVRRTAEAWGHLTASHPSFEEASLGRISFERGGECTTLLRHRRRLGEAAGLDPSLLDLVAHRRAVSLFAYAKGWMIGYGEHLQSRHPDLEQRLDGLCDRLISQALVTGDVRSLDEQFRDALA